MPITADEFRTRFIEAGQRAIQHRTALFALYDAAQQPRPQSNRVQGVLGFGIPPDLTNYGEQYRTAINLFLESATGDENLEPIRVFFVFANQEIRVKRYIDNGDRNLFGMYWSAGNIVFTHGNTYFADQNGINELWSRLGLNPMECRLELAYDNGVLSEEYVPITLDYENLKKQLDLNIIPENQYVANYTVDQRIVMNNSKPPLNQILFGPPGTGKTYSTVDQALKILDPDLWKANAGGTKDERECLKKRFDEYLNSSNPRIRFVTFHQSFSYEDFVEGLRAKPENGQIDYAVEPGLFKTICDNAKEDPDNKYVLIIDEINRGNISRIFGELITLIEDSKRAGKDESLSITLPYSKDPLTVPANLYIIGTMNTADRSLAGLDIALRRRFEFIEMPPRPELLDGVNVDGVKIGELLRVMNKRIEVLLDREHRLGHAYFMGLAAENENTLDTLATIFRTRVRPLLQEYFFEDWQRIAWVLNDQNPQKQGTEPFLQHGGANEIINLFGNDTADKLSDKRWEWNEKAFNSIGSYLNILG